MNILKLFKPSWSSINSSSITSVMGAEIQCEPDEENSMLLTVINKGTEIQNNLKECQDKEEELGWQIVKLERKNSDLLNVLTEYDNTVLTLLSERNVYRDGVNMLAMHLAHMELSFNDVNNKYGKAKKIISAYDDNQNTLTDALEQYKKDQELLECRYERLRDWCNRQLQEANEMVCEMNDKYETEIYWLRAKIKTLEITKNTLQENFNQKCLENNKLSLLYDTLCLIPEHDEKKE